MRIEHKKTEPAEFYYHELLGMFCVVGTTIAVDWIEDLYELWESPDLLTEIEMPDSIDPYDPDPIVW